MPAFKLAHPCGVLISPDLTESSFNAAAQNQPEIKMRDMHTGWVWYDLPVILSHEKHIRISLAFHQGTLRELSISHDDALLYGRNWSEWSGEKEELRAKNTESWLNALGFQVGKYRWGEIWAGYDSKGGGGGAIVRYKSH